MARQDAAQVKQLWTGSDGGGLWGCFNGLFFLKIVRLFFFLFFFLPLALLCWDPPSARASISDLLGVGARGTAMGMAYTAVADDYAAAFYNPAGLTQVKRANLTFQFTHAKARFQLGSREALLAFYQDFFDLPPDSDMVRKSMPTGDMPEANGVMLGFSGDMGYLTGFKNLYVGLAMYIPFGKLVQTPVVFRTDVIPHFVRYFDALQGMDAHLALAYRIQDWLSVGAGLHSFLNLEGETFIDTTFLDIINIQDRTYVLPGVNRQALWSLTPMGAVLIKPTDSLRLGLVYRGSNQAKVKYDQYVAISLGFPDEQDPTSEQSVNLLFASLPFDYTFYYTPESVTGGISFQLAERFLMSLDLAWYRYSAFVDGKGNDPEPSFSNVWIPRFGAEYRVTDSLDLYGGYFYEASPVPDQERENNYLDMDRHVFSCGAGYHMAGIGSIWKKPVTIQALLQGQYMPGRDIEKAVAVQYGPSFGIKGYIIQAGLAVVFHH